jgi:two-component system phosphate regulon sensor histidine kinase PhoR
VTSLTARLYSLIAILLGAGLLVAGIALDRDASRMAARSLEDEGRRELGLLRLWAPRADIARGDIPAVDAWADRAGLAIGRRVTVIDSTGRVLGDSDVPLDSVPLMENHAGRPEVRAALDTGLGEASRRSWTIRRQLFYIAEPLVPPAPGRKEPRVVLRISIPTPQAHEFAHRWQRHLWFAVGGVFLVVLAGGYVLGRRVDRRLRTMRRSAEALGQGDLATRIAVDGHDELGALARVLNSMAERLDSKLSELHAERDLSQAVIANLSEGVALLAPDLTLLHTNERFWRLVGAERPSGPSAPRLAAARQPALEEIVREAMRRGTPVRREASIYVEDRREHEVAVAPVREGSETGAWLLTIRDLDPERAMANLRREFVANVSHELKTPLTSIQGYAETLLHGALDDEANRARFVETIRNQAVRLEAIVDDLLELADLDRPDAALNVKDWDLAEVVRDMAAGFEETAARRGLALLLEVRPGLRASFDRKRVEVALRNLLDNAIKYTESGSVRVSAEAGPATIRVSVTDTGRGIEAQHLPRVFERFYRVDHGRARATGGTGLGLSIVKHAIELHGGRVGLTSAPGRGSTFWFEIPAAPPS